jgi:hypothetical protein
MSQAADTRCALLTHPLEIIDPGCRPAVGAIANGDVDLGELGTAGEIDRDRTRARAVGRNVAQVERERTARGRSAGPADLDCDTGQPSRGGGDAPGIAERYGPGAHAAEGPGLPGPGLPTLNRYWVPKLAV